MPSYALSVLIYMVPKSILEFVEGLNNYLFDMIIQDYSKNLMNEFYKNSTPKTLKLND